VDDLTKGCLYILLWTAIFIVGLIIGCRANKPIGIIIMLTDALVLYIKLKASCEVQAERRRRRRYEQQQWRYAEEAHEDEK
jgi:hypothetical protein